MKFEPPEIIKDMSNADYHSHYAISKSAIDYLDRSPLHYWERYLNPHKPPFIQTDAMRKGELVHTIVLEPDLARDYVQVEPSVNKRAKDGKEELAAFKEANKGKLIVTQDEYDEAERMANAIAEHDVARDFLDGFGSVEGSMFWSWDERLPVRCRCRPDFVREDAVLVDLKTALSAAQPAFSRKIAEFRYHLQAAFYMRGYQECTGRTPKGFVFVAIEKTPPYSIGVYRLSNDAINEGLAMAEASLAKFWDCYQKNEWPDYNDNQLCIIDIPSYAYKHTNNSI